MTSVISFGTGRYQIAGSPGEQPPTMHIFARDHDQPIGADVPDHDRSGELVLSLQFHNRQSIDTMIRALLMMRTWFPPHPFYSSRTIL